MSSGTMPTPTTNDFPLNEIDGRRCMVQMDSRMGRDQKKKDKSKTAANKPKKRRRHPKSEAKEK